VIRRIADAGLKVHMQLLSNDEDVDGFSWTLPNSRISAPRWTPCSIATRTVISCHYYHEIITTGGCWEALFVE